MNELLHIGVKGMSWKNKKRPISSFESMRERNRMETDRRIQRMMDRRKNTSQPRMITLRNNLGSQKISNISPRLIESGKKKVFSLLRR